ncbi:hypothetical protein P245_25260 [Comamonas thiooxydans]|uniref:Uncharacterized protein n=1 Tax=Comamonas thiooxydans TaxID=363952 RepID=A0A0E3B9H4_9BURK|nr:hypothetical protein P245_25260 [Comamonas thiooxydans]
MLETMISHTNLAHFINSLMFSIFFDSLKGFLGFTFLLRQIQI